jgi:hypothetical protein
MSRDFAFEIESLITRLQPIRLEVLQAEEHFRQELDHVYSGNLQSARNLVHGTPAEVETAYFRVASRIRYRLQLFNNLSFDQVDRLRIEVKMKKLAESS